MQLDLNLFLALDALLDEGSVGGAAARLHVSSPAMSRTLDRIRHMTGDPVLVRAGRTMTRTPYAESIQEEVHAVVARAQAVLARQRSFDVSQLERCFTIQCHDALACAMGPALTTSMREAAPHVTLRFLAEAPTDTPELRKGEVDLHIGAAIPAQADVQHALLGHDTLVVAMRGEHPLAGGKLTARRYAGAEHIIVSRRGRLRDPVDDALAAQSLSRATVASAPTATAALCMASVSDLLVVVPKSGCASLVRAFGLLTKAIPVHIPPLPIIASWHMRHEGDRAHVWLRGTVAEVAKAMLGLKKGALHIEGRG